MEKVEPYWHKNKDWYFWNKKTRKFELTKNASKKAIESYKNYYRKSDTNLD